MILRKGKRHRIAVGNHEGSWAVSYVDMLTLLLCFFIIFFSSDKVKGGSLHKIASQIKGTDGKGEGKGGGRDPSSVESSTQGQTKKLMEQIRVNPKLTAHATEKEGVLEIRFDQISFFNSGSTLVTNEGKEAIQEVIEMLAPYQNEVRVTVQGHTDSRNVVYSKKNAADNWELSVIRATSVLKQFRAHGFPQEGLSAEGFADTKVERDIASDDFSKQRRITLRIEEIKK